MQVPDIYYGREQAFVKHHLLETYLLRLFMIIGLHQRNIRYVDCFSGPWQEGSDDFQDTSIGISLKIIKKCRERLKQMGRDVTFYALFIEKDKSSFQKLQHYLSGVSQREVSTKALPGDFYNLRGEILEWCGQEDFTFFFIDPTGWKMIVEIPTLAPLLRRPNSEFLINFMYDFLLRAHNQELHQQDMYSIFGKIPDTDDLTPEEKEERLVSLYLKHLKEILPSRGGKPRAVTVPVLKPTIDRTLYHLVYLTRHPKGITVFMEASEKLDLVQRRTREQAKQNKREARSHQMELFQSAEGVHKKKAGGSAEVKSYWLNRLTISPQQFGIEELADMLEETRWFESDLQAAFGELERDAQNLSISPKIKTKANALSRSYHEHENIH